MASDEEKKKKAEERKKADEAKKAEEKEREFKEKNISEIQKLIAAIVPDYYSSNAKEVKKLKKGKKFWEAVNAVKLKAPIAGEQYQLSYNSTAEGLEPVYFWILDFLDQTTCEKLIDNFASSPGSGHFAEMGQRATRMQEEGMKIMQTIGVLTKSIIPIIYDLRQFELRLDDYKKANSDKPEERETGILSLKQIWLDNVDVKRGNSGIKAMTFSQQGAFVTLLNAFLAANTAKDVDKLDLNDIVKRVLAQRISEFETWKKMSEGEIRKRYNIERAWMKSQVESLKLYSRWAKPYFQAAEQLRMTVPGGLGAAMINAFNTMTMQLVIVQKKAIDVEAEVLGKSLPRGFNRLTGLKKINACLFVDLKFRGIPQRMEQHYTFGGKADVTFKAYGLTDDELAELKTRLGESDLKEALKFVQVATEESIKEIQDDIEHFLKEPDEREIEQEKSEKRQAEDVNPFGALIGIGTFWGKKEKEKKKEDKSSLDRPDNYAEKVIRQYASFKARKSAFTVYDIYKKAHGMAAQPFGDLLTLSDVSVKLKDVFKK